MIETLRLITACFHIVIALLWSVNLTYRQIMQAIKPLTHIAQLVSDQKAYNLRFPNNQIKEFQNLNTVFNELLEEIQKIYQSRWERTPHAVCY